VQKLIQKKGLKTRFADIRETHGTYLIRYLKEPEIDFIHGRVTSNVFMRNYFNPALIGDLEQRTLTAVQEILSKTS
jgi:intergrase/recombinase